MTSRITSRSRRMAGIGGTFCSLAPRAAGVVVVFVSERSSPVPGQGCCTDVLEDAPAAVVERVMLQLTRHLGLVPLEGTKTAQLIETISAFARLRDEPPGA